MNLLSLQNPAFVAYVIVATLLILKVAAVAWLTVLRMMQVKGGFRAPEDLRRTPLNPRPDPKQLEPNERVERMRRIQMNNLENLPFFLAAGLIYLLTDPPAALAQWLFYGYLVSRVLHFLAYATAQVHEVRATFWTIGSVIVIYMAVASLVKAIGA